MAEQNGYGTALTVKEMLTEIRNDIRNLSEKVDKIDRQGSIGTREELGDHERRLRSVERWAAAMPLVIVLTLSLAFAEHFLKV